MKPIKLAIIDDDSSYRNSLKDILAKDPQIRIYKEYETGLDLFRDINSPFQPDVYLIDIKLGKISGIECAKKIRKKNPCIPIIIMTAFPDIETFCEARKIGADYIEKNARAESLFKIIILSSNSSKKDNIFSLNENQLNHTDLQLLSRLMEVKGRCSTLSQSQIQILKLKKSGKTVKEISHILGVHPGTVGTQLSRIYEKLDLPHLLDYI